MSPGTLFAAARLDKVDYSMRLDIPCPASTKSFDNVSVVALLPAVLPSLLAWRRSCLALSLSVFFGPQQRLML